VKRKVDFHPAAFRELNFADDWYEERRRGLGDAFRDEVFSAIDLIAAFPQSYQNYIRGTRRAALRRFPFKIVYREVDSTIQIIAVAHSKRKPEYWKDRLEPY